MTDLTPGRHEHRGRHEARSVSGDYSSYDIDVVQSVPVDPSFDGLFVCTECDEPWDTRHDEIEGCPYESFNPAAHEFHDWLRWLRGGMPV